MLRDHLDKIIITTAVALVLILITVFAISQNLYSPPGDEEPEIIEEEDLLFNIIREYSDTEGITIKIGAENKFKQIKDCSVVVASYEIDSFDSGGFGVIGPTRMNYSRVNALMDYLSKELEHLMEV